MSAILNAFQKGYPVTTRSGRPVQFMMVHQGPGYPYPLVVQVGTTASSTQNPTVLMENYDLHGRHNSVCPSDLDLVIRR